MFIVLLILWGSALVGYLLRSKPQAWVSNLLTASIWLLLFTIGIEVGGNEVLTGSLGRLGSEALLITVLTTLCCGVGALLLWRYVLQAKGRDTLCDEERQKGMLRFDYRSLWTAMRDSIIICTCFACGCVLGYFGAGCYLPEGVSRYALWVLLACVGFGIGQNEVLRRGFRRIRKSLVLLPVVTLMGTWAGAWLTALLLPGRSLADWMAVSSGFGYYSLSSMLISELRGVELGTVALMYNILREVVTLLFAPLLLRLFGPLAPISVGGATTADTTLPIISRISGAQFIPIAIFHGLMVDFSVPLLVPLFCSM